MSDQRQAEINRSFVALASSLVNGYDVVDLLTQLTEDCARLLDIASAGLLLADGRGLLHVVAASSERTRLLEVHQLQRAEGPCRDCFLTGTPVSVPDLQALESRWPSFVPAACALGFASVHALPMRLRDNRLGALGLFGTNVGVLAPDDLALGQALADVASVALVQERAASDSSTVNQQLQTALTSRVLLEQAKGVLAQLGDLDRAGAFTVLRRYARDRNLRLSEVAAAVVERSLAAQDVLDSARPTR